MKSDLAILILAGGGSERLDQVKSLVKVNDKSMIRQIVDRISPLSERIFISCKAEFETLKSMFPDLIICRDKFEKKAPLTGLVSSLPCIEREYVAILPCDSPKVNPKAIELLYKNIKDHNAAIPKWPNGFIEPLIAIYRVEELSELAKKSWEKEEMKLSKIIDRLEDVVFVSTEEIKEVDEELETFLNINTLKDLEKNFEQHEPVD